MNGRLIISSDITDLPPGLKFKRARLNRGLTVPEAAELAKVPARTIYNFESGSTKTLLASQLTRLARVVGQMPEDLFGNDCYREENGLPQDK